MTRLGRPWPAIIVVSSLALALAVALDAHGVAREVLALWFFLTCPGLSVVGLLDIDDPLAEGVLAVAVSIAIGILIALAMVLTHTWSPDAGLAIALTLSLLGAILQAWRSPTGPRAQATTHRTEAPAP
jgi:uncharacterized membrane protein